MHQNESFLPDTTMTPFYYRGAHNEPLPPGYSSNTGAAFTSGTSGMGDFTITQDKIMAFAGLLAGVAIMYAGWGKMVKSSGAKDKSMAIPLLAAGAGVAYFVGMRKL